MTASHEPSRPSWRCAACGHDWPCRSRREELLGENTGGVVPLALLMASYYEQAVRDHPSVMASTLYARFLGWVRHHHPRPR